MSKPKSQAQLDRATDQRLRKTYGITLAEYGKLLDEGGGGCWICGTPAGTRRLHVDHAHDWKKVVLGFVSPKESETGVWFATAVYNGTTYTEFNVKKSLASRGVKRQLLRASVRGLLCYRHNSGLQKFSDHPGHLRSAAEYLDRFTAGRTTKILEPT